MRKTGVTFDIEVRGLVQGVGFRPFVYRIAVVCKIRGWVQNRSDMVAIRAQGGRTALTRFVQDLERKKPPLAEIEELQVREIQAPHLPDFRILESSGEASQVTRVSPDLAVCGDCLRDMKTQENRLEYPFINCTYCGPRFSIIRALPYDRANTTMLVFGMCPQCRAEYENIADRRFHAQPVACRNCGPQYHLFSPSGTAVDPGHIPQQAADMIAQGLILAVKGIGGYFLACDALNEAAVRRLRDGKQRYGKPFAVMFRDLAALRRYAFTTPEEETCLTSSRRPILLLQSRRPLAPSVCNGFSTIGAMLPYLPLHYLMFERMSTPVMVLTSGNRSEEPIVIDDRVAGEVLADLADAQIGNNREIHNRVDDSVMMVVNRKARFIRRSRGYVPEPVQLRLHTEGIFAAGAELVNTFALGKGRSAVLSQHIGDLQNAETLAFYRESAARFADLFRFDPERMVCDLHPDYLSTRYVRESGVPCIQVQHHHAHIASCMAEHGLDEPVIGISLDGTGLGSDGHIWGGEFMVADLLGFRRMHHFEYLPLPGGDAAVREPWRLALALLHGVYGEQLFDLGLPVLQGREEASSTLIQAIKQKINCPLSAGAGRLFDAVAALSGLCGRAWFHAEAPMRLESVLLPGVSAAYSFEVGSPVISFHSMVQEIVEDLRLGVAPGLISARFHNTVVGLVRAVTVRLAEETGIRKVILSGGTFQNRYLLGKLEEILPREGLEVYSNLQVPVNDGGIALGQLAIAAKMRECHVSEYTC